MDRRFETDQAVINCALEKWKSVFPEANLLVLGRGVAQPEQPLAGDKALFEATLKIWKKWQPMWDDGGWENSEYEKRMEALCQRWMRPHSPESSCIIAYVPTAAAL